MLCITSAAIALAAGGEHFISVFLVHTRRWSDERSRTSFVQFRQDMPFLGLSGFAAAAKVRLKRAVQIGYR
jgi:hypothetical protein